MPKQKIAFTQSRGWQNIVKFLRCIGIDT